MKKERGWSGRELRGDGVYGFPKLAKVLPRS